MTSAPSRRHDDRFGVLALLAAGSLGMLALGTVELWSERARVPVDADIEILLLLLSSAPIGVMTSACKLVSRRRGRAASAGRVLLVVAAVLIVQGALFGASSALAQEVGCGRDRDDWCGFGSGIFGAIALAAGAAAGGTGAVLWLLTRRTARST